MPCLYLRQAKARPADGEADTLTNGKEIKRINGVEQSGVYRVEGETDAMRRAKALAEKHGYKAEFFMGANAKIENGGEVRGMISMEKKLVAIRVDHAKYDAYQIMAHEMAHDAIAKGDINLNEIRTMLEEHFTAEELDDMAAQYAAAFTSADGEAVMTAEEAFEEICCDALGGINVFAEMGVDLRIDYPVLDTIRSYVSENESTQSRAPPSESSEVKYSLEGINKDGIEVYETSDEVKALTRKERQKKFLEIMQNEYRGRTAKFVRNGHTYYAKFDSNDVNKNIYGDKRSSNSGYNAKIKVGADGNIFELVENAKYNGSESETGKTTKAHKQIQYWDYYVKTVQIDNHVYDLVANVRRKSTGDFVYSIQLRANNAIEASAAQQPNQKVGVNKAANASDGSILNSAEDVKTKNSAEPNTDELQAIQSIGRKSVNDFSSSEIETVRKYAERYWREMGVKSPFFRAWFGDWRANDKSVLQIANRKGSDRGLQHNEDTGWDINVSGKVFNETKAHTEKFNREAVIYLPYINDIVKKAVLLDSYTIGKAKSSNSLMMHSLYAVADAGDGAVILKLYVEEMNDPNSKSTAKRAYQLQNIEKYQQSDAKGSGKIPSPVFQTADIGTVSDLFDFVKTHDKNFNPKPASKVVNEDGTPMKVYHGTSDVFWEFKNSELSPKEDSFFFAQNREDAAAYTGTGRIMSVYVNLQNPVDYNNMPSAIYKLRDKKAQVAALKELGYDGWMADMETGWGEVSAFYPEQIKSATDNIGTFGPENPDIRYSAEPMTLKQLEAENKKLKKQLEYWRNQTRKNPKKTVREGDVKKLAKAIVESCDTDLKPHEIVPDLIELGNYILNEKELRYTEVHDMAESIATDLIENATEVVDELKETRDGIKSYLKTTKFIDNGSPEFKELRSKYKRRFRFAKKGERGIGVDTAYMELQDEFGLALFPDDAINPAAQLERIAEAIDKTAPQYFNPNSYYAKEAIANVTNSIIDGMLDETVRQSPLTAAERYEQRMAAQKAHFKELLAKQKEHQKKVFKDYKQRQAEKLAKKKLSEKNAAIRDKIQGVAKKIGKLYNSKDKHNNVKEVQKGFAGAALSLNKVLFSNTSNADIVRAGTALAMANPEEARALQRYEKILEQRDPLVSDLAEVSKLIRADNRNAKLGEATLTTAEREALNKRYDELKAKINDFTPQIKALDKQLAELLKREKMRIDTMAVYDAIDELSKAYAETKNNPQNYASYEEAVQLRIDQLKNDLGKTISLKELNTEQLNRILECYKMVYETIKNANTVFSHGKRVAIEEMAQAANAEINEISAKPKDTVVALELAKGIYWKSLIPVYYFERLGSKTLMGLYDDLITAQDDFSRIVGEADDFITAHMTL